MATRFALRHRTSRRWLACCPSLEQPRVTPLLESDEESEAASYGTKHQAEMERLGIPDFAGAYEVLPVEVAMCTDEPEEPSSGEQAA